MRYFTAIKINILAIIAILFVICCAYFVEFALHEPPCPLCLLQRFGLLAITFGLLLNLKYGIQMQHYGIALLSTLFTAAVAIRQILLHIFVASGAYGPAIFNLHLYTWTFIFTMFIFLFISFALVLQPYGRAEPKKWKWVKVIISGLFITALFLTLANATTTFLMCGFSECPESPTSYKYLIHDAALDRFLHITRVCS
jgi:disulfide bond formation protein DsbB